MPLSITGAAWSIWGAAPGIRAPGQRCSHLRCASNDGKEVSLREFLLQLPPYRRRKVQQPAHPASGAGIRTGPAEVPLKPLRRGHLGPRRGARRRDAVAAALANGGVFAVDKPAGPTSADVVAGVLEAVTKKLKVKLGHGGTLDPFATGVLVLGLGHGTRMLQKFLHGGKEYVATVQMGTETDTQDYTGHALRRCRFDHVRREVLEDEQMKIKAKELKKTCKLNCAACQLRLQLWHEAEASCNVVLKDEPQNLKALFRRAQAHLGSKNFEDSMRDVKKALDLEPQNREAKALVKEVQAAQKEEDKKSKGFFGKMCQALGTGQIPEPYVDRRFEIGDEKDPAKAAE